MIFDCLPPHRFSKGVLEVTTESKVQLYNEMMSTRDELDESYITATSHDVEQRLLIMEEFRTAMRVGVYTPFANEVRTDFIFTEGDRHRKELYTAAKNSDTGEIGFYRVKFFDELETSMDGLGSDAEKRSLLRDVNSLDALVVPGVAFDLSGGRMGMGGAYYKDLLEGYRGQRIALAYDFQVVSKLPMGVGDHDVDWIVTEKRLIRCAKG
jgi:5-formyltetrahydrofolate cyclo-ligase